MGPKRLESVTPILIPNSTHGEQKKLRLGEHLFAPEEEVRHAEGETNGSRGSDTDFSLDLRGRSRLGWSSVMEHKDLGSILSTKGSEQKNTCRGTLRHQDRR